MHFQDETQSNLDKILEQKSQISRLRQMLLLLKNSRSVLHLLNEIQVHQENDCLKTLLLYVLIQNGEEKDLKTLLQSGIDVFSSFREFTPLEMAITCNNLEKLCTILYFNGYHHITRSGCSPFLLSIQYGCSEHMQNLLLDYEDNFNEPFQDLTILFYAISYKSPVILEIVDRGGDLNYFHEDKNIISHSLRNTCPPEIFKVIYAFNNI